MPRKPTEKALPLEERRHRKTPNYSRDSRVLASRARESHCGHSTTLPSYSTHWRWLWLTSSPFREKESLHWSQTFTISNRRRTSFSDSPLYLEVRVDEDTLKNVVLHSVATALARRVFPVPGGPTINTPCRENNVSERFTCHCSNSQEFHY